MTLCKILPRHLVSACMGRATTRHSPEDRRSTRRRKAGTASVRGATFNGRLIDFSRGGIAIETSTALRIGARYHFEIRAEHGKMTAYGVVRWCRLRAVNPSLQAGDFEPLFTAGIRLSGSSPPPAATVLGGIRYDLSSQVP